MSETSQNKNSNTDEIDLLDLFRRMGTTLSSWAKAIGRAFLISTVFLLRRCLPLGISLVAGVVISLFLKSTSESFYTSDMVLRSNFIPNSEMISYINKLHNFCSEGNREELANSLSFATGDGNNILDISAFWIIDKGRDAIPDVVDYENKHDIYDTINVRMQDRFDVRVTIMSPQELAKIRNAIITFIKKDSLFEQRKRIKIRQNTEYLARLNSDILQLDSLQKVKYFEETRNTKPQNGGQLVFLQEQRTQLIYSDTYKLYDRKQALESESELYWDIVTVIIDFSFPSKPENGIMYYSRKIIPLIVGLTILLLILLANRKRLAEVMDKY
jgi:hypothetical protein